MPRKTKTDELQKMSRRLFTKTLAGLGLSAGVINHMTKEALAEQTNDPTKEVPRLYGRQVKNPEEWKDKPRTPENRPEMEERWYTIPRSKWVRVETAEDAATTLGGWLDEQFDDDLLDVAVANEHDRPNSEKRLVIKYTKVEAENEHGERETVDSPDVPFERVEEEAPYEVTGVVGEGDNREKVDVPVSVERRTVGTENCGDSDSPYFTDYYDPVPAGVKLESCTTGAPGYSSNYGYVMTTAGHCYGVGEYTYQPNASDISNYFGTTRDRVYHGDDDSADTPDMVYMSQDRGVDYYIGADGGGTDYYIIGNLYWDNIQDMHDGGIEQMYKQGKATGRCSGSVRETYPDKYPRAFEIGALHDGGDSGGPHFTLNDYDHAYYAGGHIGYTNYHSFAGYWEDHYDMLGLDFT